MQIGNHKAESGNVTSHTTIEEIDATRTVGKNQCSGCGKYFVGASIFDMHHKGKPENRRCMTAKEMREAGLETEKRLVRIYREGLPAFEEHAVWYSVKARESIRTAFAQDEEEDV